MNVCFATQAFVRHPDDAIGSFVFCLAEGMAARGLDVTVVAPHAPNLADAETICNTDVVRFHYAAAAYERLAYQGNMQDLVKRSMLNKAILPGFVVSFAAATIRAVRHQKSDLIHAHWWFPSGVAAAVASAVTGVPLVVTCHGTDVGLIGRNPLVDSAARQVFGRARAVTVVSSFLRDSLVQFLPSLESRVSVVPMPVTKVFTENGAHLGHVAGQERTILAAGRLSKQKGFDNLITAAFMLRGRGVPVKVLFAGNGEEEKALRKLAERMHVKDAVEFLGTKTPPELAEYYRTCDVVVLPSHDEGLGLTLVEAMFCGTPVVGSRSGGISDLIRDGETGLLVPPGDPRALADALQRLLVDPAYASQLGRAGQEHARRSFDPAVCVQRMLGVYEGIASGHALRR